MSRNIKIEAVMTEFPHTIGYDQPLDVAKNMMQEHGLRHLPVKDSGKLVGIVSDRDINFVLSFDLDKSRELRVEDVYTAEPYAVDVAESLEKVVTQMAADHIGCALVEKQGELVGIFTTVDACRYLGKVLRDE